MIFDSLMLQFFFTRLLIWIWYCASALSMNILEHKIMCSIVCCTCYEHLTLSTLIIYECLKNWCLNPTMMLEQKRLVLFGAECLLSQFITSNNATLSFIVFNYTLLFLPCFIPFYCALLCSIVFHCNMLC